MEKNLDQIRQELADIHDELLDLPADAYERRTELQERQNELRKLSHELVEGEPLHDAERLKAAYGRLQKTRDRLLGKHMQFVSTEAGDAGITGEFNTTINRAIDAGMGIDEIEARLKEIIDQMRRSG
ncbi:MAG: hypothetical protein R3258_09775 [Acidimicrobiia bacterium]|nr:hypothetical protein [Acidimicrobiia bacterium]